MEVVLQACIGLLASYIRLIIRGKKTNAGLQDYFHQPLKVPGALHRPNGIIQDNMVTRIVPNNTQELTCHQPVMS